VLRQAFQVNKHANITNKFYGTLYEPPYLDLLKLPHPTYDVLNFKITGYDYPVLESYQRFVHKIAESMDLNVSECWAHPPQKTKVLRYKQNSSNVEAEYNLTTYERFIQISDIQAPIYTVFLRFIQEAIPEGVTLSVVHHTDFIEESRFVPDKELLDLKAQLDAAGGPRTTKK
jgi:large subunit ribosomal protein L48